jgi:aryl-alcohol dehydrogenase-like predicted oxidoreductase
MSTAEVVELDELTRIGFGCYRLDRRSAQHRDALTYALGEGCNLIDTASNYADGRSEELVGDVLEDTGARAFVITKVGYVSPSAAARLEHKGVAVEELPRLQSGTPYSVQPRVLQVVLELSRERLRRPRLDAVLLHNPERLLETGATASEVRDALRGAFDFLDHEVARGRLRHFGVSSNILPTAKHGELLDFEILEELSNYKLAFIEFPLNLLERQAATGSASRASLLSRSVHVKTLVNRPLNALVDGQQFRLADTEPLAIDDGWDKCVKLVTERLDALGQEEHWTRFRPMQFLRDNRNDIPDPDLVDAIWTNQIDPFVVALFGKDRLPAITSAFDALRERAKSRARAQLAERSRTAISQLYDKGLLDRASVEPLAIKACRYGLAAGADHVLVGMRRPEYVEQLAPLLTA